MTRNIAKATAFRALAAAATVGLLPMGTTPVQASPLSDCYDYIMSACPGSITEYGQCINEGFGLCDNQHPQPMTTGELDLEFLPWDQRRIVQKALRDRGVPFRVYATPMDTGDTSTAASGRR